MQILRELIAIHPELINRVETSLRIENPPYLPLCVEQIEPGPHGLPAISIAHYGEQNGDLMRDPEMCFELEIEHGMVKDFQPYYFRNDYLGVEQLAVDFDTRTVNTKLVLSLRSFARTWDANLEQQGYLRAYTAA
jgi:uncharacterized protein DUF6908